MSNSSSSKKTLPLARKFQFKSLLNGWPWAVWIGAALLVILLLPGGLNRVRFYGVAEKTYEYIAPLEDSRITRIYVDLGEYVETGTLIATLENQSLATELLMNQASLLKTRDRVASLRADIEILRLEEAEAKAQLHIWEEQWKRTEALRADNVLLEQEIIDLRPQMAAQRNMIARYPAIFKEMEQRLLTLEEELALIDADKLNQLQMKQSHLVAQKAGVVAEIMQRSGDVVRTGDGIVRISNLSTDRVIAFIPEEMQADIIVGNPCRIISTSSRNTYLGTVESITADIRKLPVFTGFADQFLRGRRMIIQLDDGFTLTPGEQMIVVPDRSLIEQWFGGDES
jgi:multidrug resistance efflux pump